MAERQGVRVVQLPVDTTEHAALVDVGGELAQFAAQVPTVDGARRLQQRVPQRRADPAGALRRDVARDIQHVLRIGGSLPVNGDEEVRLVADDRAAERKSVLALREVRWRTAEEIARRELHAAKVGAAGEAEHRATEFIRPALRHRVHRSTGEVATLDVVRGVDHLDLLHRLDREREGRAITAARIAAEKRLVVVHAIHQHVRRCCATTTDRLATPGAGATDVARARGEHDEILEVATVSRQVAELRFADPHARAGLLVLDQRRVLGDHALRLELHRRGLEIEILAYDFADRHANVRPLDRAISDALRAQRVGPGGKEGQLIAPAVVGLHAAAHSGFGVDGDDAGAGDTGLATGDDAAHGGGGRRLLSVRHAAAGDE